MMAVSMDTTRHSLLIRVKDPGDHAAWSEFDEIYRPMIARFARSCGLRPNDVDDVVQHCMLSIHQHIKNFEYDPARGRFKGWLRNVVSNRVRDLWRKKGEVHPGSVVLKAQPDDEPLPEEHFERLWMQEHAKFALKQVKREIEPSTFEAYVRYFIEERPTAEVCAEFGMNRNQLFTIKYRVNKKIKAILETLLGDVV